MTMFPHVMLACHKDNKVIETQFLYPSAETRMLGVIIIIRGRGPKKMTIRSVQKKNSNRGSKKIIMKIQTSPPID